jgi:hypothetical protein
VPACDACNQATKKHEQIVAFIARLSGPAVTREQMREFEELMRRMHKHHPLLLAEMAPSWLQQHDFRALGPQFADEGPFNASGPLLSASLDAFAKKLAHSFYYTHARRVLPPTGGMVHKIFTNYDRQLGRVPQVIFRGLTGPLTLQQGKFNVANQFEYAFGIGERFGAFVASFRTTLLIHMIVHEDRQALKQLGATVPIAASGVRT